MPTLSPAEAHALCSQLIAGFYRCIDTGDITAAAKLFGVDGTWLRQGATLVGETQILAALSTRVEGRKSAHLASNFVIDIAADNRVSARYFVTVTAQEPGEKARVAAILDSKDSIDLSGAAPVFVSKQASIHVTFD